MISEVNSGGLQMLLTIRETAEQLKCSEGQLRRLIKEKRVPAMRLSPRIIRLDLDDVRARMKANARAKRDDR